jgi:hypothetical protein
MRYCQMFGDSISTVSQMGGVRDDWADFGPALVFGFAEITGFFGAAFFLGAVLGRRLSEIEALC